MDKYSALVTALNNSLLAREETQKRLYMAGASNLIKTRDCLHYENCQLMEEVIKPLIKELRR